MQELCSDQSALRESARARCHLTRMLIVHCSVPVVRRARVSRRAIVTTASARSLFIFGAGARRASPHYTPPAAFHRSSVRTRVGAHRRRIHRTRVGQHAAAAGLVSGLLCLPHRNETPSSGGGLWPVGGVGRSPSTCSARFGGVGEVACGRVERARGGLGFSVLPGEEESSARLSGHDDTSSSRHRP